MSYYKIIFETSGEQQADELLAVLSDLPFNGFEHIEKSLIGYIDTKDFDEQTFKSIIEEKCVNISKSIIKNENWNQSWESNFEPVIVYSPGGKGVLTYIRADFHQPSTLSPQYEIIITPKMSFGTGHHATTYQMVEHMSRLDFKEKAVIDFGSGTGVLAILAEKMGAAHVLAIECEDWTVENARDNAAVNQCKKIDVRMGDHCFFHEEKAHIILANINLNVIKENLIQIKNSALPQSRVIFSGFLESDKEAFLSNLAQGGLVVDYITCMDNWLAVTVIVQN
jgi:ribosomal protein L11 methyltransferase